MDDVKIIKDQLNRMEAQSLKSYNVQVSTDNKNWANYTLAITPSEFILCQYNLKTSHFWKLISRFEYNGQKIYINFNDNNYIIQSPNVSNLISDMCEIIQRILLPSELNNIEFQMLNAPPIEPGTQSADSRFMMQQTGNLHINTSKKEISSIIKYRTPMFRISSASEVGFLLHAYLDILPLIKTLKIIELPIIGVDYMKIISNFPLELRYTRKIEINGSINPILFTFLERVKQSRDQSKLSSLSFSLSNFNRNDLSIISNSIIRGPINSIEFHRAFHPSSVQYFYSTFLSHQMNGMLWILNLDKTTGIDLNKLFPKIRSIPFVSLAYCDIDIVEALTIASESKMGKLTILNLTGNNASSSSVEKIKNIQKISSLRKLILNNINWPDHFTTQFLNVLFDRYTSNLSLSFSNAKASENEWNELFEFFENCEYDGLIGFSWISNPININLFHFLGRNGQLRSIDFDDCFDENCTDLVKEFSSLLKASVHLRYLSISGSNAKHIGRPISSIIEACTGHKSLRKMNFPFSYGGDEALPLIVKLVESTPELKRINFEGLCLTNHEAFLDSMMKLSKSKEGLKVNFPLDDLNKFKGVLNKDDEKELKKVYKDRYIDSSSNTDTALYKIKPASEPLLNKKRVYYRCHKKDAFPSYITDKTIQRLKDELVDIPDQIAEKKAKEENKLSKTVGYVPKKPPQQLKLSYGSSKGFIDSFAKVNPKGVPAKSDEIEEEEDDDDGQKRSKKRDYSKDDSLTESEHPFEKGEMNYSDNANTEDNDESLTQSFSSLSNPANQILRKSSNLPKNMAISDYDDDDAYDPSIIKSPSNSKVTLSSGFDSLSNSDSIEKVEFKVTPKFDKSKPYNFSSDMAQNEDLSSSEQNLNKKGKKEDTKKAAVASPKKKNNKNSSKKNPGENKDQKVPKKKTFVFDLSQDEDDNVNEREIGVPLLSEDSSSVNANSKKEERESKFDIGIKPDEEIKDNRNFVDSNDEESNDRNRQYSDDDENNNGNLSYTKDDDESNDKNRQYSDDYENNDKNRQYSDDYENNDKKRQYSDDYESNDKNRQYSDDYENNDKNRQYSDYESNDKNRQYSDDYENNDKNRQYSDDYENNDKNRQYSDDESDNKKRLNSSGSKHYYDDDDYDADAKPRGNASTSDNKVSSLDSGKFTYSYVDAYSENNKYDSYQSNDEKAATKYVTINRTDNNTNSSIEIEIQNSNESSIEIEINPVKDLINQNTQVDSSDQNQIKFQVPSEKKNREKESKRNGKSDKKPQTKNRQVVAKQNKSEDEKEYTDEDNNNNNSENISQEGISDTEDDDERDNQNARDQNEYEESENEDRKPKPKPKRKGNEDKENEIKSRDIKGDRNGIQSDTEDGDEDDESKIESNNQNGILSTDDDRENEIKNRNMKNDRNVIQTKSEDEKEYTNDDDDENESYVKKQPKSKDKPEIKQQSKPKNNQKENKVRIQRRDSNSQRSQNSQSSEKQLRNRDAELEADGLPVSSDAAESGKEAPFSFTPRTPKLSIFTKSIFNINNEDENDGDESSDNNGDYGDYEYDNSSENEAGKNVAVRNVNGDAVADVVDDRNAAAGAEKKVKKPDDPRLPPIGKERDWKFQIKFNMDPDLSKFKQIYRQNSPSILYDILSKEKNFPSKNSSTKSKK